MFSCSVKSQDQESTNIHFIFLQMTKKSIILIKNNIVNGLYFYMLYMFLDQVHFVLIDRILPANATISACANC